MSVVTNVVLSIGMNDAGEDDPNPYTARINAFFPDEQGLVNADAVPDRRGWYGGTKYLEVELYIGAFNHLDLRAFVTHLRGIAWEHPADVQLLICAQEDFIFSDIPVFPRARRDRVSAQTQQLIQWAATKEEAASDRE